MEPEVASVFHLPHGFQVIVDHEHQPVVEVSGCDLHPEYPNFNSFYVVYALVRGWLRVWVLLYSAYLAYTEVRYARDKNKKKKKNQENVE